MAESPNCYAEATRDLTYPIVDTDALPTGMEPGAVWRTRCRETLETDGFFAAIGCADPRGRERRYQHHGILLLASSHDRADRPPFISYFSAEHAIKEPYGTVELPDIAQIGAAIAQNAGRPATYGRGKQGIALQHATWAHLLGFMHEVERSSRPRLRRSL